MHVDPEHRSKVSQVAGPDAYPEVKSLSAWLSLQGIGRQLTQEAIEYLQSIKCTRVVLHASAKGKAVYQSLGFVNNNEMKFDISNTLPYIPS